MESPPPYYSSAPKKSNTGLIVGLILGAVAICCIVPLLGLGGLGLWGYSKIKGVVGCTFTFSNIDHAMQEYVKEHDGHLPKAETWQSDIKPYYLKQVAKHKEEQKIFSSDTEGAMSCSTEDGVSTGITFNKELSGKKLSDIKSPYDTILLFETPTSGTNLSGTYKLQPFESSPQMMGKHRGWYVTHVSGGLSIMKDGRSTPVDVNINTNSNGND